MGDDDFFGFNEGRREGLVRAFFRGEGVRKGVVDIYPFE